MGHDREAASQRWRELISAQEASGQSIAAYCREHDVRAWQFYEWKKRLRKDETGAFVAVSVKAEEASSALPEPVLRRSAIELRNSRGWILKVEPGFDAVHLRRLLSVLESGS
ncbi:MAG: IS66 family insertion sequence element accessory protein TnpA [Acidobacteriota bacterium]